MTRPPLLLPLILAALVAAAVPAPASAQAVGRIEGRVQLRERPARRTPNRYPGGAGGAARPVQAIPAVAYLEGAIGAAGAAPRSATLAQRDTAFSPGAVVIPVGGTVVFPNQDPFFHNVFSYSTAERFDLGRYPRGESKTVAFDRAGVVKVYCEVHESMRAAVVVTENPFHALVAADGTFTLVGVPAGVHSLVVWHVDLGEVKAEVRVPEGGTARVKLNLG